MNQPFTQNSLYSRFDHNSMKIWQPESRWGDMNKSQKHLGQLLEIEISEVGDDYVKATMPINEKTQQPFGLLHGGAACALAESIGSMASSMVAGNAYSIVGVSLNAHYLRAASEGIVTALCTPLKLGRTIHFWDIAISDKNEDIVASIQFSTMIRPK